MTSSPAFQAILESEFTCIQRVAVGQWAMVSDELSVWRRRPVASTGEEVVPLPPAHCTTNRHCHNCHLDSACWSDAAPVPHDLAQAAADDRHDWCSTACKELWTANRAVGRGGPSAGTEPAREKKQASASWQALVGAAPSDGAKPKPASSFSFNF